MLRGQVFTIGGSIARRLPGAEVKKFSMPRSRHIGIRALFKVH